MKTMTQHQTKDYDIDDGIYFGPGHSNTHPTSDREPSSMDVGSINECFDQFKHSLNGFILIIVGIAKPPHGLLVLVNTGNSSLVLNPEGKSGKAKQLGMKAPMLKRLMR